MMARRAGVYGAKGVSEAFREMARLYNTPIGQASRFALQPILKGAKANTKHASVKKALVLKKDAKAPKTNPTHLVGGDPKNPDYRLLHLLEFGTEAHEVNHPGTTAQPFLTPAYEAHGAEAITRFGEKIGPALEKQAAKLARKYGGK
ncbi:HK97-gp10 family putative phage morphogenesis protein [Mesorhizobium sp. A623]